MAEERTRPPRCLSTGQGQSGLPGRASGPPGAPGGRRAPAKGTRGCRCVACFFRAGATQGWLGTVPPCTRGGSRSPLLNASKRSRVHRTRSIARGLRSRAGASGVSMARSVIAAFSSVMPRRRKARNAGATGSRVTLMSATLKPAGAADGSPTITSICTIGSRLPSLPGSLVVHKVAEDSASPVQTTAVLAYPGGANPACVTTRPVMPDMAGCPLRPGPVLGNVVPIFLLSVGSSARPNLCWLLCSDRDDSLCFDSSLAFPFREATGSLAASPAPTERVVFGVALLAAPPAPAASGGAIPVLLAAS